MSSAGKISVRGLLARSLLRLYVDKTKWLRTTGGKTRDQVGNPRPPNEDRFAKQQHALVQYEQKANCKYIGCVDQIATEAA